MGKQRLPAAVFGKSEESKDQFKLLWCDHDFPDIAKQALEALRSGFQFKGSRENTRYKPCYAIWPTKDNQGWIAARFLDAGEDSLGRPHTLRIEAVYLGSVALADAALYLSPENWPTPDTFLSPGTATFDASFSDRELLERLLTNSNGDRRPSVFRVFEDSSSFGGFQIVIDEHTRTIRKTEPHRITTAPKPIPPHKPMSTTTTRNFRWSLPFLAGLVLAGTPGVLIWKNMSDKVADRDEKVIALEESLDKEKEARESEMNNIKKERDDASKELAEYDRKKLEWSEFEKIFNANDIGIPADLEKKLPKKADRGSEQDKYTVDQIQQQLMDRIIALANRSKNLDKSNQPNNWKPNLRLFEK